MKKERAYPWLLLVLGAILLFAGNQDLLVTDPVESNYAELVFPNDLWSLLV